MNGSRHDHDEPQSCAEFDCSECGRHIVVITASTIPEFRICAACQTIPGWYRSPQYRAVIAPEHDGREVWERGVATG